MLRVGDGTGLTGAVSRRSSGSGPLIVLVPGMGDPQSEEGALALRINRLEAALRRATGDIEELQNENRKLADQLRRFREDVEFRLSGKQGAAPAPTSVGEAPEPGPTRPQRHNDSIGPAADSDTPAPTRPQRHSDVFDPDANPDAPGAPRQIGTTSPSAPLNLASRPPPDDTAGPKPLPAPERPKSADDAEPNFVAGGVPFSDSREQFKAAVVAYRAGQYADAEAQFPVDVVPAEQQATGHDQCPNRWANG